MGMFDTMNQAARSGVTGMTGAMGPGMNTPNGGSFAQKMQMKANPVMQGRPAVQQKNLVNAAGNVANAWQANRMQKPNNGMQNPMSMMGQINKNAGMGGSNSMNAAKGAIGGSYNQLLTSYPQLEGYRNTGQASGQDMSWMDKPGALQMPEPQTPDYPDSQVQSGLSPLQSPLEQQIMREKMAANPDIQMGAVQAGGDMPYQEPAEDMGSRDPREILRMKMLQGGGQTDVMPRGIGPSVPPVVMDENGLEPRRGAR